MMISSTPEHHLLYDGIHLAERIAPGRLAKGDVLPCKRYLFKSQKMPFRKPKDGISQDRMQVTASQLITNGITQREE